MKTQQLKSILSTLQSQTLGECAKHLSGKQTFAETINQQELHRSEAIVLIEQLYESGEEVTINKF